MKRPNILLILADQHRCDCLGCYGNPDVKTPCLDALAQEGVRYDSHYTVYPVCTPSRYSMLSGQYTHQHNAWSNESTLPPAIETWPKLLRSAGFHTAAVGKMHFTPTYQDVGFDTMVLCEQNGAGRYEDDYHTWLKECGLTDNLDLTDQTAWREKASQDYFEKFGAFSSDLDLEHHSTGWITRQALARIEGWDAEGGNVLMAGYVKPHHPFDPPRPYSEMYDSAALTILPGYTSEVPAEDYANSQGFFDHKTLSEEKLRRVMAMYYGAVTQIDDGVGEMIRLLREKDFYDNTMIIYTSDHGEYLGYHHMLLKSNFLYEPLARIPLIVKYPVSEKMTEKHVDARLCENIDLSATILSVCRIAQPVSMAGKNLPESDWDREFVFSEGQYGNDAKPCLGYMVRSGKYKLLVQGSLENGMFFDLENDPLELKNEFHNPGYAQEIDRHRQALYRWLLFDSTGKTYCDRNAPQRNEQKALEQRSEKLLRFVEERIAVF